MPNPNPNPNLQITKIFSLRPPTFLSTKTNELTLIVVEAALTAVSLT